MRNSIEFVRAMKRLELLQLAFDVEVHAGQVSVARERGVHAPKVELRLVVMIAHRQHADVQQGALTERQVVQSDSTYELEQVGSREYQDHQGCVHKHTCSTQQP